MNPNKRQDSPFLKACRREKNACTPVWLMRQAGRYMKEYRDLRAKVSFLDLCENPDLAAEVTVGAAEKIGADAAIIFSDILLVPRAMGMALDYLEGEGPQFHSRIAEARQVEELREFDPLESLPFVYEAIRKTRQSLKPQTPLIGFVGAPFTLAAYMIEGGSSRNFDRTKQFIYQNPGAWNSLMQMLVRGLSKHLNTQIEAGADAVQIFDTWVGNLGPADYRDYVLPHMRRLIQEIRPGTPVIYFGTGTTSLLPLMKESGCGVLGLDFRVELGPTWDQLGKIAVQGNLDPAALLGDHRTLRQKVEEILRQAKGRPGHIFNLGHGVLPSTPVENVITLIDMVHEFSAK